MTTQAKHTPGPWTCRDDAHEKRWAIIGSEPSYVCGIDKGFHNSEANARLIALAPEMADALRAMLEYSGHLPVFGSEPSVKNVRLAAKWVGACDTARALLATLDV